MTLTSGLISPTPMMGGMMSPPPMLMPTPIPGVNVIKLVVHDEPAD